MSQPPQIIELSNVSGDSVFLSDVQWESATVGGGKLTRNRIFSNPKKRRLSKAGVLLQVGGAFYEKGLYAHANSSCVFKLDGKWDEFESVVGLQTGSVARVKFLVKGDGRTLYESDTRAGSETDSVKLNVKGIKSLELIAQATTAVTDGAWTVWASPMLKR